MQVFGSSGARGEVGAEFTPEFVLRVARAAATVWDADRVALGRDTRTTGELFADAAAAGVAAAGTDVVRLGVAPTPATVRYCGDAGVPGVQITASHNPPEYNGVKLIGSDASGLSVDELERVEATLLSESTEDAAWDEVGESHHGDAAEPYLAAVTDAVDRAAIAAAGLTVAVDPGHGAAAETSPTFFRRLGCDVVTVNAQADGHFPGRHSEPTPNSLADLGRLVRARGADVGVAHDGDGDRAVFVDETGTAVSGDASLAALAERALSPGDTAVSAVNVSQRLVDVCDRVGAELELTPIGATNIVTRIRRLWDEGETVPIAGEGNGGVFFPAHGLARDGALVAGKFLELLAAREAPVSEVIAPYTAYHTVRDSVSYDDETERTALLDAAEQFAAASDADPSTTDGYRLDYGDAWLLVRESGTEPKLRVYAESSDRDRAESLAARATGRLREARETV